MIRYKKMDRKSLAIRLGPSGVEVRMPQWASRRDPRVREAILQHLTSTARLAPPEADPPHPLTRQELQQETIAWARKLKVTPSRVQVRAMSTRWGSCTSRGNVTLSDRILQMPQPLREYLICHELAHLRFLNHGSGFRQLMTQVMPDWKLREEWLAGWIARRELQAMNARRR